MMYHKPKIELIHSENNDKTNNCSRGRGKAGNTCFCKKISIGLEKKQYFLLHII